MRFQWLKDYQELEEQILYLKWNLNKSKLELARWIDGDLANVKISNQSRSANLEESILKVEKELVRLDEQKEEMLILIDSFKGLDNQIMFLKYVKGETLEEIAEDLQYSPSYIQKKHSELRKSLDYLDEYLINRANLKMKIAVQSEEKLHKSCTTSSGFRLVD